MAADYTRVEVTRKIVEFHLDTPATIKDFDFVRHVALEAYKHTFDTTNIYDDALKVDIGDDEIVFSFEYDQSRVTE